MSCFMQREMPAYVLKKTCAVGILLPYAKLGKPKKERKLKQVAYCFDIGTGGQTAKVLSEVFGGELAGSTE
jgi:hypothetical protein